MRLYCLLYYTCLTSLWGQEPHQEELCTATRTARHWLKSETFQVCNNNSSSKTRTIAALYCSKKIFLTKSSIFLLCGAQRSDQKYICSLCTVIAPFPFPSLLKQWVVPPHYLWPWPVWSLILPKVLVTVASSHLSHRQGGLCLFPSCPFPTSSFLDWQTVVFFAISLFENKLVLW